MGTRVPKHCQHRASGQGVVRLDGRDFYTGPYGTPASRGEYDRLIAEWLANGRRMPTPDGQAQPSIAVNELILAYTKYAKVYYVKDGRQTSEFNHIRLSLRALRHLYGNTPIAEFDIKTLKTVRNTMIEAGRTRAEINRRIGRIVRAFAWGVENNLVPPSVHHGLKALKKLPKGRSEAREARDVKPVPDAHVDAVLPFVSRQVAAMIGLQRLTGMRSGEVCMLRLRYVDRSREPWEYRPPTHKTSHLGKDRVIYFGPMAQEVLGPFLKADPDAHLFSPFDAMTELSTRRRDNRKTPMTPSQRARRPKPQPKRPRGHSYTPSAYNYAIRRACIKAGVPHWFPHQIRHAVATRLRSEFNLDTSRVVLGHTSPVVTEIYAEIDHSKAADAMRRVG